MSYAKRVAFGKQSSGIVSSAGWLYADLLLVLVIVGFGVASINDDEATLKKQVYELTSENSRLKEKISDLEDEIEELKKVAAVDPTVSWQLNCREFGLEIAKNASQEDIDSKVRSNFERAVSNRGLDPNFTKVGIVLAYGGYDKSAGETTDQGQRNAEKIKGKLEASPYLTGTEMIFFGASRVNINESKELVSTSGVYLKIYLVYRGDATESQCSLEN